MAAAFLACGRHGVQMFSMALTRQPVALWRTLYLPGLLQAAPTPDRRIVLFRRYFILPKHHPPLQIESQGERGQIVTPKSDLEGPSRSKFGLQEGGRLTVTPGKEFGTSQLEER